MLKLYKGNMIEYENLPLVDFYDNALRTPTKNWDFDAQGIKETECIAFTLTTALERFGGLGLSANQLGLGYRVCVVNMGDTAWVMFNPKIIEQSEELSNYSEGCISYPGLYLKLDRSNQITVSFQAIGGQPVKHTFDGLTAVCVQHELDHLDGIVYTDCVSPINLEKATRKVKGNLKKIRRLSGVA